MPDGTSSLSIGPTRTPWNKGKLIGAKPPLRSNHVWSIRTRLMVEGRTRDLAMFNMAIDSKLHGCDVMALKVEDVAPNGYTIERATVRQRETGRPVPRLASAGSCHQRMSQKQSARNCAGRLRDARRRYQAWRLTYSATASAKIALPCCVCKYQAVKRKT
jgi:hypothetical protein